MLGNRWIPFNLDEETLGIALVAAGKTVPAACIRSCIIQLVVFYIIFLRINGMITFFAAIARNDAFCRFVALEKVGYRIYLIPGNPYYGI